MRYGSLKARLLSNSVLCPLTGCRLWAGKTTKGRGAHLYGRINLWIAGKVRVRRVHRVAWTEWRGEIPEGFEIDHKCHNTLCINFDHLDCVPPLENQKHKRKGVSRV